MEISAVQIPLAEVNFHPLSFGDPRGRVFWWQGQLYRGVSHENVDFVKQLFQDGVVKSLIDKGLLVQTERTNLTLDGYGLVLKHGRVPFVSYCYEWCFEMLKDAALLIIDLEIELRRRGLTLQDAHPWNVLFDGPRPVYVDISSIGPNGGNRKWWAYEEFCRSFTYPLRLMVHGYERVARWLLQAPGGILQPEFTALVRNGSSHWGIEATLSALREATGRSVSVAKEHIPTPLRPVIKKGYVLLRSALQKPEGLDFQEVRRELAAITIPSRQTPWSEYYGDCYPPFTPSEEWTQKHNTVYKVLSELCPSSVLDIGSNRGWYTKLAALLGSKVVALDSDEVCINQLYSEAKKENRPVLPLVMDFCLPSPGYGVCYQHGVPAMARLNCDLVLASALIHHLVFGRHLNFEQISEGLATFSKRWLLVEFIPEEDEGLQRTWSQRYSWYTQENFLTALKRHFHTIKTYASEPPRILFLCEK